MRCKNCHTVMMDTDLECPSCHASVASATAAPPQPGGGKPNGLLMLLPIFGGALGGLAYAALADTEPGVTRPSTGQASGSGSMRRIFGLLFILGGGLFFILACVHFFDTWGIARREPKAVTAAELCRKDFADKAPGWMAYTFTESKPTQGVVTRRRLGRGGEVQARALLVRVDDDHWLTATVAPGFEGNQLVGRLLPGDMAPSQPLIERLKKQEGNSAEILSFEFNAVDATAADLQIRYVASGWMGGIGFVGLLLGFFLFGGGRRTA